MKHIKYMILTISLVASFGLAVLPTNVNAVDVLKSACRGDAANTAVCKDRNNEKIPDFVHTLTNALLFILGAVSVIVIILAGITYTTSGGDPELVKKAMNSLRYSVIGLVVALLAYAIVNFVLTTFNTAPANTTNTGLVDEITKSAII